MPRGNMPRQPSRSGRQEGARRPKGPVSKTAPDRASSARVLSRSAKAPVSKAPAPKNASPKRKPASGYDPLAPERVRQIIAGLDRLYPDATCALTHRSAWELLVATILSAQCTDVRVNMVTPVLFEKYPTVQDFAALEPEQVGSGERGYGTAAGRVDGHADRATGEDDLVVGVSVKEHCGCHRGRGYRRRFATRATHERRSPVSG